jgi:hypothetical protein
VTRHDQSAFDRADLFKSVAPYEGGLPGHYGVDTSVEAANFIAPAVPLLQEQVFAAVARAGANGLTVVEGCEAAPWDRYAAQPRFSELRKARRIADSGMRRRNPSGVNAIVWVLPEFVRRPGE